MKSNYNLALIFKTLTTILLGLLLTAGTSFSQDDPVMKFVGKIKDENGKPISGATVRITANGKEVHTAKTDENGEFTPYSGYYGYNYKVEVIKGDFVKNTFEVNSKNYDDELLQAEVEIVVKTKLVEKQDGIDYSVIENKPIEKFAIDKNTGQITFNSNYADSREKEIDDYFDKLKGNAKENAKKYKALVKSGDAAFDKKDYKTAINDWKQALEIEHSDELAIKITDAEIKYEDELEKKERVARMNKLIKEGDGMADLFQFENAKEKYEAAQYANPDSKLPKQKLKELEDKIANQQSAKIDKEYNELMARADIKTNSGSFEDAKKLLEEAKTKKPKEKEPAKKIKAIDKLIKELAKNKAEYDKLIIEADAFLASKSYEKSKEKYSKASELITTEQYPKDKLKEIEKALADLKQNEEAYNTLMAAADKDFKDKSYENAIVSYQKASELKTEESLPKEQIIKAKQALAELKKAEEEYKTLLATADKEFNDKKYAEAIVNYKKALKIKENEARPTEQIKKAEAEIEKQKKLEEDYNNAIAAADKAFEKKEYESAILDYEKALKIKQGEAKPTEQIKKAKEALLAIKKKEEDYQRNMATADKAFADKRFEEAISSYEKASLIKEEEPKPKEQIEKAKAEIEKIKKQDEEFQNLVAKADKEFSETDFENALTTYNSALLIKPENVKVKEQIAKATKEIAALKKKEADYANAMTKAESLMSSEKYTEAIASYNAALAIQSEETKPKEGIKRANDSIEAARIAKEKAEAERIAKEKAEEERLAKEKAEAERIAKEKAEAERLAKELADAERLAKEKAEAERLANEKAAADKLAKEKAESDRLAKELADADRLAKEKADAERLAIEKANADKLAKEKAEADRIAREKANADRLAKEQAEAARLAKEQAEADQLAKERAEAARLAKEQEDADRLAKEQAEADRRAKAQADADRLAKEQAEADRLAKEKADADKLARDKARADQLAKDKANADKLAKEKEEAARLAREQAEASKLADEKARLARENAQKEAEEQARLEAEKARLAAEQERDADKNKRYFELIKKADEQFDKKNFKGAKNNYNSALAVKPNERYPKEQIRAIEEFFEQMTEEERNTIASTDDYFNVDADLYGEEVDMSSGDGSILITNIEDNSALREYEELIRYIDSSINNDKKSELRDQDFSYLTYQKFEELKDKISLETGSNDYGRNGSIASINLYLNAYAEDRNIKENQETSNNLANYVAIDRLNDKYIETRYEQYNRNNGIGQEYQNYSDKQTDLANVQNLDHLKTNEEVYEDLVAFKDQLTEEYAEKSAFYRENNKNYEEINDKLHAEEQALKEKEALSRKEETDYLEKTQEAIKEKEAEGNKKTGIHNAEYIEYADDLSTASNQLSKNETVKINTTKEQLEKIDDKRIEENQEGEKKAINNAESYNDLQDKLDEQKNKLAEADKESQKRVNEYMENTGDKLVEERKSGQAKITNASQQYQKYQDSLTDANNKKRITNTDRTLQTSQELDKLKDKKTEENTQLAKENEGKGDAITEYQDKLSEKNKEMEDASKEKSLKNSEGYTDVQETQNIPKSEGNKDELALLFPEGVTQKVYQKKNSYGEIVSVTVRRVVVKGNKGDDYIHKKTKAGSFYFKNGKSISESTWDRETSGEIVNQ